MKFDDLPDLTAMHKEQVEELCKDIEGKVKFSNISNGRYEYDEVRVVRYRIIRMDSREELVVEMTGFPTIDDEQIKQ